MSKLKKSVCSVIAAFGCSSAMAYNCDGVVASVGIYNSGQVIVSYGSLPQHLVCSVSQPSNGVNPDACRGWLATFLAAQAQQKSVRVYYDPAVSGNPASCSAFQYATNASPFMMHTLD